ncbi:MAG TPA: hypothetical protein PKW21_09595 [Rhabdaerophilum sp.]|nr:hypothetical protein [Rhabdaerophilum sp.]
MEETAAPVEAAKPQGAEEMPAQEPSNDKYVATEPLEELSPAPSPSTPGLIADADLAALSDDIGPHLAPLESLSPVGSYDSGGTRFTMYSDGSVVALGPDGERRFRSLEELRRHIGSA